MHRYVQPSIRVLLADVTFEPVPEVGYPSERLTLLLCVQIPISAEAGENLAELHQAIVKAMEVSQVVCLNFNNQSPSSRSDSWSDWWPFGFVGRRCVQPLAAAKKEIKDKQQSRIDEDKRKGLTRVQVCLVVLVCAFSVLSRCCCCQVAIVGRPNVGKSTLVNALIGEVRSCDCVQPCFHCTHAMR